MLIAIHTNPSQPHQVRYAEYLQSGFNRHGLNAVITHNINLNADIHVVIGPWYALNRWRGHSWVIWVDRCYYRGNPSHVSVGWLNKNGGRDFHNSGRRKHVERENRQAGTGSIFLADYEGPIRQADTIRLHPARENNKEPLHDVLRRHARAIGYKTTALVTAYLMGLDVVSHDPEHILNKGPDLLPYADWHYKEIESGELWEHLQQSRLQLLSR